MDRAILRGTSRVMSATPVESVLFLHGGALGDFVLTLHVVAAVRQRFPGARVDGIARCPLARWAAERGLLDHAWDPDSVGSDGLYAEPIRPDGTIAKLVRGYDLVISFLGGPHALVATKLRGVCPGRVIAVDPYITAQTQTAGRHILDQWRQDIAAAGLPLDDRACALFPREGGDNVAPDVIVHPGSGGRDKCAPFPVFETVVRRLADGGRSVAWMIGPVELDLYGEDYAITLQRTAPVLYEESIQAAADRVCAATTFIGNDAGMTHLAAACGLRTVALFGPTDPSVWRPVGPDVRVVASDFQAPTWNVSEVADRIVRAALSH
jgi:hypothetical protein